MPVDKGEAKKKRHTREANRRNEAAAAKLMG
jgi:hypothetical protein